MDDKQLAHYAMHARHGDRRSFRTLVETLSRWLIAIAVRYTQDWENALDITQETWLKVYSNIGRYDPGRPFRAWIGVIHRNNCLSFLRATRSRERCQDRFAREPSGGGNPASSDPLADAVRRDFGERIRNATKHLTESQRAVFSLVDIEQTEQEEAARILGMKRSTLRSTLHFARKRLAQLLRDEKETT